METEKLRRIVYTEGIILQTRIELEAMLATNQERQHRGETLAYDEDAIRGLIDTQLSPHSTDTLVANNSYPKPFSYPLQVTNYLLYNLVGVGRELLWISRIISHIRLFTILQQTIFPLFCSLSLYLSSCWYYTQIANRLETMNLIGGRGYSPFLVVSSSNGGMTLL